MRSGIDWSMDDDSPCFPFTPVPVRARRDGWTPERQRAFIAHVAAGMPSNHAAAAVGMSKQTAHALRARPGAESFAAAWQAAARHARRARTAGRCRSAAAAIDGVELPVVYRGRVVGTRIRYDNVHLARLLSRAIAAGLLDDVL